MRSWTNWMDLAPDNVKAISPRTIGVYVIRTSNNGGRESDIIYVGTHKSGKQKLRGRLINLIRGLKATNNRRAKGYHSASTRIRRYARSGLQFSWIECSRGQEGVEKAVLMAYWISTGRLPECNREF